PSKPGSTFTHDRETAQAGFYQVYLADYQVDVKLTSTLRTGYHQYKYEDLKSRRILFDLGKANNRVSDWKIEKVDANTVQGFQRNGKQTIHFYATLNETIERLDIENQGAPDGYAVLRIADGQVNPVEMKIALSFVSV